MGEVKVSVVIPVYNASEFLRSTLESVLGQTMKDFEVIAVDDGSTDSSVEILKEYAARDARLQWYSKENEGPGLARNYGIDRARGKYLYFFDSDDILVLDALEMLVNRMEESGADMVIGRYDFFDRFGYYHAPHFDKLLTDKDEIDRYDPELLQTFTSPNRLFKRTIIEEHGIRYPALSNAEDAVFIYTYIFYARKLVAMDYILFHYRKVFMGAGESITANASIEKFKDYCEAYDILYELAERSILRDHPECSTIKEARQQNPRLAEFLGMLVEKEVRLGINQFYRKFWQNDEETISFMGQKLQKLTDRLTIKSYVKLQQKQMMMDLANIPTTRQEMIEQTHITVVLYSQGADERLFIDSLKSVISQDMIYVKIVLPEYMEEATKDAGLYRANMMFVPADNAGDMYEAARREATTEFIVFGEAHYSYRNDFLVRTHKLISSSETDVFDEKIYRNMNGNSLPLFGPQIANERLRDGNTDKLYRKLNYTLANKIFRTSFLRMLEGFSIEETLERANIEYFDHSCVIFAGNDADYIAMSADSNLENEIKEEFTPKDLSLSSDWVSSNHMAAGTRLIRYPTKTREDRLYKRFVLFYKKRLRLKNRVLFYCVRRNGRLEGNSLALYPSIKGRKKIFAKRTPHDFITKIAGVKLLMESKVIITDDYVWHFRYIPIHPDQRVIQLWHACGAFKTFGVRGSTLTRGQERATHARYDMVCVSSEFVRPIYADAFGIDIRQVAALGDPRTDIFFDKKKIDSTKEEILKRFPAWRSKQIIIYAPTFREYTNDRTVFNPELDFDRLSRSLKPDQIFVVCPHPIMKNDIIDGEYDNIFVCREFSTTQMMMVADLMVTDYSSVIFEFALLDKPMVFFCYDMLIYDRSYYFEFPEELPGEVVSDQSELEDYLSDPSRQMLGAKHEVFKKRYMSACDGHSTERIAKLVNSYMGK